MPRDLITVALDMTLEDCLGLMDRHGIYHLLAGGADLLQAFLDPVH